MRRKNVNEMLRTHNGRIAGTGTPMERYDDNYNPTDHVGVKTNIEKGHNGYTYKITAPGVDGVMLPNDLSEAEYQKYVNERCGEVKTYNIKEGKRS